MLQQLEEIKTQDPNQSLRQMSRGASHFLFKQQQDVHSGKRNDELALEGQLAEAFWV